MRVIEGCVGTPGPDTQRDEELPFVRDALASRAAIRYWVSRPEESHLQALAERSMSLSTHFAPIIQPLAAQTSNGQIVAALSSLHALASAGPVENVGAVS